MKKLLISVMVALMALSFVGASGAWFHGSDSASGTITAGTMEVEITPGEMVEIEDIKPCKWGYAFINIHNIGDNMGCLWVHFANVVGLENGINDPEQEAYWERTGLNPDLLRFDNDMERFITIDMWIDDNPKNGEKDAGEDYIIDPNWHWKLADLECQWIPIEECLEPCSSMDLAISFHLQEDADNRYQSDQVLFDLEAKLCQPDAPDPEPAVDLVTPKLCKWRVLRLENKEDFGKPSTPGGDISADWWAPLLGDNTYGVLTYKNKGSTFDYSFDGQGLAPDEDYKLIYYADPWPGKGVCGPTGALIAAITTDGTGAVSVSGSVELNTDMPNSCDANHPDGAKIWLVLDEDYSADTPGDQGQMTGWSPDDYLFEMRLIQYNDTGV